MLVQRQTAPGSCRTSRRVYLLRNHGYPSTVRQKLGSSRNLPLSRIEHWPAFRATRPWRLTGTYVSTVCTWMTAGISCRRLKDSILVDNESGNSPFWLAWLFPCTCRRCLGTDRVSFDRSQNRHVRYPRKQAPGGLPRRLRTRWPWPGSRPSSRSRSYVPILDIVVVVVVFGKATPIGFFFG